MGEGDEEESDGAEAALEADTYRKHSFVTAV